MKLFRSLLVAACATLAVSLPFAAHAQGKPEKPKVSIAVGGKSQFYYLPLTVAERLGHFKGDDVSIIGVGTSSGAIAAMKAGSLDAMSNVDPIMTMLESSGDVVIIADTRTAAGTTAVFGSPDMPAAALYAPVSFIKNNPN